MKKHSFLSLLMFVSFFTKAQTTTTLSTCAGSPISFTIGNPYNLGNPVYSINPGGLSNSTGVFTVAPFSNTVYNASIFGTNSSNNMVKDSALVTVIVKPTPSSAVSVTPATCNSSLVHADLNITISPSSTSVPYSIVWDNTPPNNLFYSQGYQASNTSPLVFNATITANSGCSSTLSLIIPAVPSPANFSLSPRPMPAYTINCYNPSITVTTDQPSFNYTWTASSNPPITNSTLLLTNGSIGNWTVYATNPLSGCTSQSVFAVTINTTSPTKTITPTIQNITCNLSSITTVSAVGVPTFNILQEFTSPQNAVLSVPSYTAIYIPASPGNYTHCVVNTINGCKTCSSFTVSTADVFPTFSLSSPQNFSLGCSTKSVGIINILNTVSQIPGAVTFTLLYPGFSSFIPPGNLSTASQYSMSIPGTYTVIARDMTTNCESRIPFSVISNTISPNLSVSGGPSILNCYTPQATYFASSTNPNVNFNWTFTQAPGSSVGSSITIQPSGLPTSSVVGNYTITAIDNSNLCMSNQIINISKNMFRPNAIAAFASGSVITCAQPTLMITNQSSSGIPPGTFPINLPVQVDQWLGSSFGMPGGSSYVASTPGAYTLSVVDLNNGCKSAVTFMISDNRIYPVVSFPNNPELLPCAGSTTLTANVANGLPSAFTFTWSGPGTSIPQGSSNQLIINNPGTYIITTKMISTGCVATTSVDVWACVGISEKSLLDKIAVYPNPGEGVYEIQVKDHNTITIEVYDISGKLIKVQNNFSKSTTLDIRDQPDGVYLLKINSEDKFFYTKLIKH